MDEVVYLAMTGGQVSLSLSTLTPSEQKQSGIQSSSVHDLKVIEASPREIVEHEKMLVHIAQNNDRQSSLW